VMAREFIGALKAARLFASEDETRPVINAVHVEAVGSALRLVSTDGHTLWCCEISARDSAADPPPAYQTPWNVSLDDVDRIVRALKDAGEVELLLPQRKLAGVEYEQRSDDFAPYRAIVPATLDAKPTKDAPEFAAEYVARACEALALYGKGLAPAILKKGNKHDKERSRIEHDAFAQPPVSWRVDGKLDPAVVFSPKFPCAFAIVMPRRAMVDSTACSVEAFVERLRTDGRKVAA
jgi:hypothetical protein